MERLHPGVFIEEVSSGVRPIEGVSTSTAAFIGKAEMGPLNKAVLITSLPEFDKKYGAFLTEFRLAHAVLHFFNNGGKRVYIVRVEGSGAVTANIAINDRKDVSSKTLTIQAANEGAWGNKLEVVIADGSADPDNEFAIQVFRDRSDLVPPLPPQLLETHDNLSMNPEANNYVEKVLTANYNYIGVDVEDANFASAGAGTSRSGRLPFLVGNGAVDFKLGAFPPNGGTEAAGAVGSSGTSRSGDTPAENPPADKRNFLINIDDDGDQPITVPPEAATGAAIAAAIQAEVRKLPQKKLATNPLAFRDFTCTYETVPAPPSYLLTSGTKGILSTVVVKNSPPTPLNLLGKKFVIEVDGDGPHIITLPTAFFADGSTLASAIKTQVSLNKAKRSKNQEAFDKFVCKYENDAKAGNPSLLLTSGTPAGVARVRSSVRVTDAPSENVATTLHLGLTNGGKQITGAAILRPANSQTALALGADGSTPGDQDYINSLAVGKSPLDIIRDVNIICVPGIGTKPVVDAGSNYCTQRMDCFFIGDVNQTDDTVPEAQAFLNSLTVKSSYGAIYYPWLKMVDPTGKSPEPITVPASGFVAGMYARIDAKRGVWKAPAGTEANVGGAAGLAADTTDVQQDFLNPIGVNVIRSFPASGIVIWGARTLATKSDPEYRYVPVRRTAIYLEQSIYNGIQWAVFEPNDEDLWASLRLNVGAFMMLQFRAGAFQGKTPNEAFFVKCDNQTTIQAEIDAGIVNILVGFAPLKPAEFVVLKLSQKAGQTTA